MAVLILYADDKGNVTRVERREDKDFLEKLGTTYRTGEFMVRGTAFHVVADTNVYVFNEVKVAITDSPRLSEEQRAEALRLFNEFKPGDVFASAREQPMLQQGKDVPHALPPLFIVFIDP